MADKSITSLPAASALDGTELIACIQGGNSRKAKASDVASAAGYSTRTSLAALVGPTSGMIRFLGEPGREGWFKFDSSNLSAKVTADPQQGLYIPPAADTTGASGAWTRILWTNFVNCSWWGYLTDDSAGAGTDNAGAINSALALLKVLAITGTAVKQYGNGAFLDLYLPAGAAYVASMITVTHCVRIFGAGDGMPGGAGTHLRWPLATCGFLFDTGSAGWSLERMTLTGAWVASSTTASGDEGEYHAIQWHASGSRKDLQFYNWQGDAMRDSNDAASSGGAHNTNQDATVRCYASGCRNVYNCDGGDVNGKQITGITGLSNRQSCILERGFLGNGYGVIVTESNGFYPGWANVGTTAARPACYAWYNNKVWACVGGQETWCQTNAPPSTSALYNQGWIYHPGWGSSVTAASANANGIPSWVTGMFWRPGGGVIHQGDSNRSSFDFLYSEDNQYNQFDVNMGDISGQINNAGRVNKSSGNIQTVAGVVDTPPIKKGASFNFSPVFNGLNFTSFANTVALGPQTGTAADSVMTLNNTNVNNFIQGYASGVLQGTIQIGSGLIQLTSKSGGSGVRLQISGNTQNVQFDGAAWRPGTDNVTTSGTASLRWSTVYAGTGTINTSDQRLKGELPIDEGLLDAWGDIKFRSYQWLDAVDAKGADKARVHFGVFAQELEAHFKEKGIDVRRYAFFCHDAWKTFMEPEIEEYTYFEERRVPIEPPAVRVSSKTNKPPSLRDMPIRERIERIERQLVRPKLDPEGKIIMKVVVPEGDRFGIRYEQLLLIEAIWQRREVAKLSARVTALEQKPLLDPTAH